MISSMEPTNGLDESRQSGLRKESHSGGTPHLGHKEEENTGQNLYEQGLYQGYGGPIHSDASPVYSRQNSLYSQSSFNPYAQQSFNPPAANSLYGPNGITQGMESMGLYGGLSPVASNGSGAYTSFNFYEDNLALAGTRRDLDNDQDAGRQRRSKGNEEQVHDNESKASLYKTELCRGFMTQGVCRYGRKCQFAHGENELRTLVRHPLYKTTMCKSFSATGTCRYGSRCRFIHDESQNELKSVPRLTMDTMDSVAHQAVEDPNGVSFQSGNIVAEPMIQKEIEKIGTKSRAMSRNSIETEKVPKVHFENSSSYGSKATGSRSPEEHNPSASRKDSFIRKSPSLPAKLNSVLQEQVKDDSGLVLGETLHDSYRGNYQPNPSFDNFGNLPGFPRNRTHTNVADSLYADEDGARFSLSESYKNMSSSLHNLAPAGIPPTAGVAEDSVRLSRDPFSRLSPVLDGIPVGRRVGRSRLDGLRGSSYSTNDLAGLALRKPIAASSLQHDMPLSRAGFNSEVPTGPPGYERLLMPRSESYNAVDDATRNLRFLEREREILEIEARMQNPDFSVDRES